ncbi:MAG: hypothetical protein AAF809_07415 [Bacteroidota bacterium]
MPQLLPYNSYDESSLYQRAVEGDTTGELKRTIVAVTEAAAAAAQRVIVHMPHYTDHGERHFLNVLRIMDALVPDAVLDEMPPLECALCVLAAYTHDLGMVLTDEFYRAVRNPDTPEGRHFASYCDRYTEEQRQIRRLREIGHPNALLRAEHIEGYLLSTYIRERHTDYTNILTWLDRLSKGKPTLFKLGTRSYKRDLALIGASHGHGVAWLRKQYGGRDNAFVKNGVNLAFPGLLLRLADIMDFDASRAPDILYRHIGLEYSYLDASHDVDAPAASTDLEDNISLLEWKKHRAIQYWSLSDEELVYEAECDHPVVHKTILSFVGWVEEELAKVGREVEAQRRAIRSLEAEARCSLRLPRVRAQVDPRLHDDGTPLYEYADITFRLDQGEIVQLLLGESLYGDPSLCLRELLQNALDAVQLRDLRLQALKHDDVRTGKLVEPVDPLEATLDSPEEKLEIEVTWGHDPASNQDFIRVTDHGVGMTRETLEEHFTNVGKSYYRSPDFNSEKALLRKYGLFATPISHFGIGILSCFMIADRLHVRTRPGGADNGERKPYDVTISGPGSLFWMSEGTLDHQGTEITLYLKDGFTLRHDPDTLVSRLRWAFGYPRSGRPDAEFGPHEIDPAYVIARYVVWPTFPVRLAPLGNESIILGARDATGRAVADLDFHAQVLAPIDVDEVHAKAAEWNVPVERVATPTWRFWDWTDDTSDEATGSRLRLWYPHNDPSTTFLTNATGEPSGLIAQDTLAAFVEPQLERSFRTSVVIKGVHVPKAGVAESQLRLAAGLGTRVWVDLRGTAAPFLKADRSEALLSPQENGQTGWQQAMLSVLQRGLAAFLGSVCDTPTALNVRTALHWSLPIRLDELAKDPAPLELSLRAASSTVSPSPPSDTEEGWAWLTQELARGWDFSLELIDHPARDFGLDFGNEHRLDFAHALNFPRDFTLDLAIAKGFAQEGISVHGTEDIRKHRRVSAMIRAFDPDLKLDLAWLKPMTTMFYGTQLQGAFFPTLAESFPRLSCFGLRGQVGDAALVAPESVRFETEKDGRTVHFADPEGRSPSEFVRRGYTLIAPMVAVPIGTLRRDCPAWREDRRLRPLGMAPFLFPSLHTIWKDHTEILADIFEGTPYLYVLWPKEEALWDKPFEEWDDTDEANCSSSLWDIEKGDVIWAEGTHHIDTMREIGKPFPEAFPWLFEDNDGADEATA